MKHSTREKSTKTTENETGRSDEILKMFEELKHNSMIQSILIKENAYYFFMCSRRQIEDIISFCCTGVDSEVLGIDTTYNLCDMWVTDSCYKDKRLVSNTTGNHPIFLGPLIFHFTKDKDTFTRFALEMMAIDPLVISKLKKIGVDMEDAIFEGIKNVMPNVSQLYCVRHLSQRDEKKLIVLLAKTNSTTAARNKAKAEILKDIYGDHKGTVYEMGLAEAQDKEDFIVKLESLKERWNGLCPGFYEWFVAKRNEKFQQSVICSAREGTTVAGMFYQNDIESMHYIEKRDLCFQKRSVVDAAQALSALALRQENDEIRALYGAGNFSLAEEYSKFQVDSARWHNWEESRRRDHVAAFRKYTPTPSDYFAKPKNAGRKANFQKRQRRDEVPTIIIDRLNEQNQQKEVNSEPSSSEDTVAIRFADPRKVPEKQFELHLRNDLPRSIKKCQGMCGKVIKPEDDGLLVRSYGTSTWTDRTTGAERSKFGPMYIHFNEKCLETFDSENFYGPGSHFDYSRIQIDEQVKSKLNDSEKHLLLGLGIRLS